MPGKIFINGYFGYHNLGDDLILELFTRLDFRPYTLTVLTREKYYPPARGVFFSSRFGLLKLFRLIRKNDILVNLGGIFQDRTSCLSFFYYYFVNLLFLFRGASIGFMNADFTDVRRKMNRRLLRALLTRSRFTILRIRQEYLGFRKRYPNVFFLKDLAFFMKTPAGKKNGNYCLWSFRKDGKLAGILRLLPSLPGRHKALIMPQDRDILPLLRGFFRPRDVFIYSYHRKRAALNLIAGAGKIVAMRYHVAVLGILMKKRTVIVAVNNKLALLREERKRA